MQNRPGEKVGSAVNPHLAAPGIARATVSELWRLGQAWGDLVARSWVNVVRDSIAAIKTESERRARG